MLRLKPRLKPKPRVRVAASEERSPQQQYFRL
jgi:hypothetical protein